MTENGGSTAHGVAWEAVGSAEFRVRHFRDAIAKVLAFAETQPAKKITARLGDGEMITEVHFAMESNHGTRVVLELGMCLHMDAEAPVHATLYRLHPGGDGHWEYFDVTEALSRIQVELNRKQPESVQP